MNRGKKRRELTPHERMHWMHKVQSNQKGRVQFITFLQRQEISPQRFVKFSVYRELTGLQIENRLYYVKSGELKYCYINRMGCKVTYIYDAIPEWAEPELLELYKQKKAEVNGQK